MLKKHFWVDRHANLTHCQGFSDVDYYKLGISFQVYVTKELTFIFKLKAENAWSFFLKWQAIYKEKLNIK